MNLGLAIPLWLLNDSTEPLERALGEVGPHHVTATLVSGPGTTVRLRGPAPHIVAHRGGWQFPPETGRYADAGLKPPRDGWFGKRNLLTRLRELLGGYDVELIARLDLPAATLVDHHPHLAQKTAWGEPLLGGPACCGHPETRALLLDLVGELRDYEVAGVQLFGWRIDRGLPEAEHPLPPGYARDLLAVCFCPACRQIARAAGVDPQAAAEAARAALAAAADHDKPTPAAGPLADYLSARRAEARTWLEVLAERAGDLPVQVACGPDETPPVGGLPLLLDLARGPAPIEVATWFRDAPAVNLPILPPHVPEPATLVRVVQQLRQHGVGWIDFDGLARDPGAKTCTNVRHAVRFAQRST